jgi:hypothetical protein
LFEETNIEKIPSSVEFGDMRIDGEQAWNNLLANEHSRWDCVAKRFNRDFTSFDGGPKIEISATDKFFCMGSCFARAIEQSLMYRGISVTSKRIISPRREWAHRPTGLANKFTTASMLNELEWILEAPFPQDVLIEADDGWTDSQVASPVSVSFERGIERRNYLTKDYFARLREADVVIFTLGYVETWFDGKSGFYLNVAPSHNQVIKNPGRFSLERTDHTVNLKNLARIREILAQVSPGCRIVITVSPVPTNATFFGDDALVANMYAKSVLRSAAQEFADAFSNVEYFPSYEIVMLSNRRAAFQNDCIHVSEPLVDNLVEKFVSMHLGAIPKRYPEFDEDQYIKANADVDEMVRRGDIQSGYQHWLLHGQAEGRRIAV